MKANESKSIHVTFTTQSETCLPVHINNVQLPQEEDVKYLGLRVTHFRKTETTRNHPHQNVS
jgi:hypothetical protein